METKQTLKKLSDQKLLENFSQIVHCERKAITQVVIHLAEIYDRRLYVREGYSSLFSYIKDKFNYSGSSAYRRIQAAKLRREIWQRDADGRSYSSKSRKTQAGERIGLRAKKMPGISTRHF